MNFNRQKYYLTVAVLTSLVFLSVFGISMSMRMNASPNGVSMEPCPFTQSQSSICPMNIFEHIQAWQKAFRALPAKSFVLSVMSLAYLFFIAAFLVKKLRELLERENFRKFLYYERRRNKPLFNNLVYLFSQGILNPKLY